MSNNRDPAPSRVLAGRLRHAAIADDEAITRAQGGSVSPVGQGLSLVTGPGSFLNGLRGLGSTGPTASDLERVGAACDRAGVAPEVVVSGRVSGEALEILARAGSRLVGVDNLYAIDLPAPQARQDDDVALVGAGRIQQWLDVHSVQFADRSVSDAYALAAHSVDGAVDLVVDCDGVPAAVASLVGRDGRGLLGGAATVPAFRGRGLPGEVAPASAVADGNHGL
jgi:hypothetical protein